MEYWATEYVKLSSTPLQRATYPITSFAKGFGQSAKQIPKQAINGLASMGRSTAKRVKSVVQNPGAYALSKAKEFAVATGAAHVHPALGTAVGVYQNVPWAQIADAGKAVGRTAVKPFDTGVNRYFRLKSKLKPDVIDTFASKVDRSAINPLLQHL